MKVIYYHRLKKSGFHIHAFSSTDIFYIPEEEIILYREKQGSFGNQSYSLSKREELLDEARRLMNGDKIEEVEVSNLKEFECEDEKIKQLIEDARLKFELEKRVRLGIEELLERID